MSNIHCATRVCMRMRVGVCCVCVRMCVCVRNMCALCVFGLCARVCICVVSWYTACRDSRGLRGDTTISTRTGYMFCVYTLAHTHVRETRKSQTRGHVCVSPKGMPCCWVFTLLTHSRSTRSRYSLIRRMSVHSKITFTSPNTHLHSVYVCLCVCVYACVCSVSTPTHTVL